MTTTILQGDCRDVLLSLASDSVHCCVTSPPFWGLRDYGHEKQIGLEGTPEEYVDALVGVFREVRRVLRGDGTLWLNLGTCYATAWSSSGAASGGVNEEFTRPALASGAIPRTQPNRMRAAFAGSKLKEKDLVALPWLVGLALQADGWFLRLDTIWEKPNGQPESASDRPTRSHEYVLLFSKSPRYFYDADAIREPHVEPRATKNGKSAMRGQAALRPRGNLESIGRWYNPAGRNKRSVWSIPTEPFGGGHFAVMPRALVRPCILAGTSDAGCCALCGAPYERVAPVVGMLDAAPAALGWEPSCECDAPPPRPSTVLDPFGGSGTVGAVATELGRHAALIELNAKYVAIAQRRTAQQGLFARGGSLT